MPEPDGFVHETTCEPKNLIETCRRLFVEQGFLFGSMVVDDSELGLLARYLFYREKEDGEIHLLVKLEKGGRILPSLSAVVHPVDWHEREAEDLFGLVFEGHPRLGEFVLHEEWPEGVNPMRPAFDAAKPYPHKEPDPSWEPPRIVETHGGFSIPIGPLYGGGEEAVHFLIETTGEDIIHVIPRLFWKYRGVEKLAEGKTIDRGVLLSERFAGTSAFSHSLAFCQAVEKISSILVPPRAQRLRVFFAELERIRHHAGLIAKICGSTALGVAESQAGMAEEALLRISGKLSGHRYLFGLNVPGGLSVDFQSEQLIETKNQVAGIVGDLNRLLEMLRFTSNFLDRLEAVGIITKEKAVDNGLVGPLARGSGVSRDLRHVLPYSGYDSFSFSVSVGSQGDGYARLRVLFAEIEQSLQILDQVIEHLPGGPFRASKAEFAPGGAFGCVEAPKGASFHWVRIGSDGLISRYRIAPPSFANWHGFHLAQENFAFQDFPIISASLGLSVAECDR